MKTKNSDFFAQNFSLSTVPLLMVSLFLYLEGGYSDRGRDPRGRGWLATSFSERRPGPSENLDLVREIVPLGFGSVISFVYIFSKGCKSMVISVKL